LAAKTPSPAFATSESDKKHEKHVTDHKQPGIYEKGEDLTQDLIRLGGREFLQRIVNLVTSSLLRQKLGCMEQLEVWHCWQNHVVGTGNTHLEELQNK
jgi:hypothetical protein